MERTNEQCRDYLNYVDWGGDWHDAEKAFNAQDSEMCWAAAASNILTWAGWKTLGLDTAAAIFTNFQTHWTNFGGLPEYGWQWWFSGAEPPNDPRLSPSQIELSGGDNYWVNKNFSEHFYENWATREWKYGEYLITTIKDWLHSGYGVVATTHTDIDEPGHAITVWGYRYAQDGTITHLWVTDSDDSTNQSRLAELGFDGYLWRIHIGNQKYLLKGVQALKRNALSFGTDLTILAKATAGGSISPAGKQTVGVGESQTFTMTPNAGHKLVQLFVDYKEVNDYQPTPNGEYTYTFENVDTDHTIEAVFAVPVTIKKIRLNEDGEPDDRNGGRAIITYGDQECGYDCDQFTIDYEEGSTNLLQVFPDENSTFEGWFTVDEETGELKLLRDMIFYAKPDDVVLAVIQCRGH